MALKAGAWLRRLRFVIVSPDLRHHRRGQAEIPLIPVFEFSQPPLFQRDEITIILFRNHGAAGKLVVLDVFVVSQLVVDSL